ncbi:hypothetical protein, partial [Actinocorallia lasiicapitis]
ASLRALRAAEAPEDLVLASALTAGRSVALVGGICTVLVLLALLRGVETVTPAGAGAPARTRRRDPVR